MNLAAWGRYSGGEAGMPLLGHTFGDLSGLVGPVVSVGPWGGSAAVM